MKKLEKEIREKVSILILLDYPFLFLNNNLEGLSNDGFNPYFIGLPILIMEGWRETHSTLFKVSILILLDYLFL